MGSRPETNLFIEKMTESNTSRLQKLNEQGLQPNLAYGPFALCNRKNVTIDEQKDMLLKMYNELIHYVMKVRVLLRLVGWCNTWCYKQKAEGSKLASDI